MVVMILLVIVEKIMVILLLENKIICSKVLVVVLEVKLMMFGELSGLWEIDWKIVLERFKVVLVNSVVKICGKWILSKICCLNFEVIFFNKMVVMLEIEIGNLLI